MGYDDGHPDLQIRRARLLHSVVQTSALSNAPPICREGIQ